MKPTWCSDWFIGGTGCFGCCLLLARLAPSFSPELGQEHRECDSNLTNLLTHQPSQTIHVRHSLLINGYGNSWSVCNSTHVRDLGFPPSWDGQPGPHQPWACQQSASLLTERWGIVEHLFEMSRLHQMQRMVLMVGVGSACVMQSHWTFWEGVNCTQ